VGGALNMLLHIETRLARCGDAKLCTSASGQGATLLTNFSLSKNFSVRICTIVGWKL